MHFMSLLNVSWFALYRQLDWFKISISVLSANREIEMKHHNWLFTNCFYWPKKTVYGPTYWSTGIFIQLFPMRRECLWQHAAAWRKGAVPSVLFKSAVLPLRAFQDENLSTRWSPSHFFLEEAMTFTEFLCPTDHVVQPHPTCSAADSWGRDSGDITIQLTTRARHEGKHPLFGAPGEKKTNNRQCQTHRQDPHVAFFSLFL